MNTFQIFLKTKAGGEETVLTTEAFGKACRGGMRFSFSDRGAHFALCTGQEAMIARTGEIAYRFSLKEGAKYPSVIRTPFGEIAAEAEVGRVFSRCDGASWFFTAEYTLFFAGVPERHKIIFKAKPVPRQTEGNKEDV